MARAIDLDKAIEIIEEKQKELYPVGRYGRNYVYGSDREKYDDWEEIIDALEHLSTLWKNCGRWEDNRIGTLDCEKKVLHHIGISLIRFMQSILRITNMVKIGLPTAARWRERRTHERL